MAEPWADLIDALGPDGAALDRTPVAEHALAEATARGWTPQALASYCLRNKPAGAINLGGLILFRLREAARKPAPTTAATEGTTGTWQQPLPPCGQCDGTEARWLDEPDGTVTHCRHCWVPPPNYRAPRLPPEPTEPPRTYMPAWVRAELNARLRERQFPE